MCYSHLTIADRIKIETYQAIYNWLYVGLIDLDLSVLRRKGISRQPKETGGRFRIGTPILNVPKRSGIVKLLAAGNFDTVVSSRGKNKGI